MTKLTVNVKGVDERKLASFTDRTVRSIQATSPDTCPLKVLLSALYETTTQSCGKCVPCYNAIPLMVVRLQKMIDFEATAQDLEEFKTFAKMAHECSDCAVGSEAGCLAQDFYDAYKKEFESHVVNKKCNYDDYRLVPCETLCPAHVKIPAYIALTAAGDYEGAINMIRRDNPFPTACGLICEHPCEKRCRRTIIDAPVNIRGIKKFATDQKAVNTVKVPDRLEDTGKKIAVIGGGPSGLSCAYFLSLMGHGVTVFEGRKKLGGMLRYGIPAYRFPRERLDEDIEGILSAGSIDVKLECQVDEAKLQEINKEFDAIYVAIGAQIGKKLRMDGIEADGVSSAVDMLGKIGDGNYPDFTGKKVAVIGGGNVAMDCARTSIRAGADQVNVIYRRRREDMTALDAEIDAAVSEGVELVTLQAPLRIECDENGHAKSVAVQPQYIGPCKNGRPAPQAANKPEGSIEADIVLIAVGQASDCTAFEAFGMQTQRSVFCADEYLEAKPVQDKKLSGVFVGGDCQTGPATAIKAIGAGKAAAYNIDEYLGFNHELDCGVEIPEPNANDRTPTGRVEVMERPAYERKCDFGGVEIEVSLEEVKQECSRCLRCDCYGYVTDEQRKIEHTKKIDAVIAGEQ